MVRTVSVQRYGDKTATMRRVRQEWTFAELLRQRDHVMPGVPVLWVVVAGSAYETEFLSRFDPRAV